jgi:transposase
VAQVWAVQGAKGVGRPVAQRLLADGERGAGCAAEAGRLGQGFRHRQGRKTDADDAHAVVMVALRDRGLRAVTIDADLQVLRLLCDRRDALSRAHIQGLGRTHRQFAELLPAGAPVKKSVRPVPGAAGQHPAP